MALRGFSTMSFWAEDVAAARDWYAELLGVDANFERSAPDGSLAYAEFRVGDYQVELGLIGSRYHPGDGPTEPDRAVMYWHVDDLGATLDRLLSMGAQPHMPVMARGEGCVTASVVDPFGNVLAVMTNPHYLEVLASSSPA